jgi:hypothetical protein
MQELGSGNSVRPQDVYGVWGGEAEDGTKCEIVVRDPTALSAPYIAEFWVDHAGGGHMSGSYLFDDKVSCIVALKVREPFCSWGCPALLTEVARADV